MMNQKKLMKKMSKDVTQIEKKIKNKNLYNIRNLIVKALIKSGIAIDYALPYIVSAFFIINFSYMKNNLPFHREMVNQKASVRTIDTSSGIHGEYSSFDYDYNDQIIEYSTGWVMNENGLYERTSTIYEINDSVNLYDKKAILSMSKEEIENALTIKNIKKISKNILSPEDVIYQEDAIIVTDHHISSDMITERPENGGDNFANSFLFVLLCICSGYVSSSFSKIFVRDYPRDMLKTIEPTYRFITKKEIKEMKKMLEVYKQNLALLTPSQNEEEDKSGYPYQLRKV